MEDLGLDSAEAATAGPMSVVEALVEGQPPGTGNRERGSEHDNHANSSHALAQCCALPQPERVTALVLEDGGCS